MRAKALLVLLLLLAAAQIPVATPVASAGDGDSGPSATSGSSGSSGSGSGSSGSSGSGTSGSSGSGTSGSSGSGSSGSGTSGTSGTSGSGSVDEEDRATDASQAPPPPKDGGPVKQTPTDGAPEGTPAGDATGNDVGEGAGSAAEGAGDRPAEGPSRAADLPPPSAPVAGVNVSVTPASGVIAVRAPGDAAFGRLADGGQLPVGSLVDARRGEVRLESAAGAGGATQSGVFSGGMFRVRQTRGERPYTVLVLAGGSFRGCPRRTTAGAATARAAARPRVVRRLWGRDRGGRFRTRGRSSSATVRGTVWLTEDRCDGTRVHVRRGAVDVRPNRGGRARRVRAGQSRLVLHRAR